MARFQKPKIRHFRFVRDLVWRPANGINCLVGPDNTDKSTVIEAIDLCPDRRRTLQIGDGENRAIALFFLTN